MRRKLPILSLAWLLAICLFFTFHPDLADLLWIGNFLLGLALIACGIGMIILSGFEWRRSRREAITASGIAAIGLVAFFTFGFDTGEQARFALLRPHYEKRLAEILASPNAAAESSSSLVGRRLSEISPTPFATRRSRDYEADEGPPLRVAFYWQKGFSDNWVGLVYDPSGIVMQANEFKPDWSNWHDKRLEPVKQLFGGDMHMAKKLADNWYLCWFT